MCRFKKRQLYGERLGLPEGYARLLYSSGVVTKILLGIGAWRCFQAKGGPSHGLNAYLILLLVSPFCRLHRGLGPHRKRNLLPDAAGMCCHNPPVLHTWNITAKSRYIEPEFHLQKPTPLYWEMSEVVLPRQLYQ